MKTIEIRETDLPKCHKCGKKTYFSHNLSTCDPTYEETPKVDTDGFIKHICSKDGVYHSVKLSDLCDWDDLRIKSFVSAASVEQKNCQKTTEELKAYVHDR